MAHLAQRVKSRLGSASRVLLNGVQPPAAPSYDLQHVFPAGASVWVRGESDWWVYNEVFVDHEYDGAIDLALRRADASRGAFVVDLGANVGYFSARLVEQAARAGFPTNAIEVLMVEGSPAVHADLSARYRDSPLPGARTSIVHGLVGRREGVGEMLEIPFGARNTLRAEHNASLAEVYETERVSVPFIDLMKYVEPRSRIDLLKCDVEGSEQLVLENYSADLLPKVEVAVLELHHRLCDIDRCRAILGEAGLTQALVAATTETTTLEVFARQ